MELALRLMQLKFDTARSFLRSASTVCATKICDGACTKMLSAQTAELDALERRYSLTTTLPQIAVVDGSMSALAARAELARIFTIEEFALKVDSIMDRAGEAVRAIGVVLRPSEAPRPRSKSAVGAKGLSSTCAELQRLLDGYPRDVGVEAASNCIDYDHCPSCGSDMSVDVVRSELQCREPSCGAIRELIGTVFDDSQFYSQEGQKAKSGTFNPNRHFQFWWVHILALESEEELSTPDDPCGERLLDDMRDIITRDSKILRILTVDDIRAMLRELDRTELNKNVPLILKKLTGVAPPAVPRALAVRTENLFTKAIEIGERVRRPGRTNRNYYPYQIFKILEGLIPPENRELRRILYYIYIQSQETVEADDADWELICDELPEITYIPTDRTLGLKYNPADCAG